MTTLGASRVFALDDGRNHHQHKLHRGQVGVGCSNQMQVAQAHYQDLRLYACVGCDVMMKSALHTLLRYIEFSHLIHRYKINEAIYSIA